MFKKTLHSLLIIMLGLQFLPSCTFQPTISTEPKATSVPELTAAPATEPTLQPKNAQMQSPYKELIEDTNLSLGNNTRMKNVIEKARNGELVNIVCIGGSVTEGYLVAPNDNCYVNQFYRMFKAQYGKDDGANVKFANAGMSGTNSAIGWTRYERDVTKVLGGNPDIFIIEFAINDYEDISITNGAALESMVRDVLSLPNQPAIILLFSSNWDWGNMQDHHIPIGNTYELPMVSIHNSLKLHIENGDIAKEDFFLSDNDHPTSYGHKIMADALMYCVDKIDKESISENDISLPDKPVIINGINYQGMKTMYQGDMLPDNLKLSLGSFTEVDVTTGTYEYNGKSKYPTNWRRDKTFNEPFVIEVNCKNMILVYKSAESYGEADIYLDGIKIKTIDASKGGAWDNAVATLLFNDSEPMNHKIEIMMANGSETKSFTIYAFSYTE